MRKWLAGLTFLVLVSAKAEAPALQLSDFAAYREIEVEGNGPLYRLELPEGVYNRVSRPDLGDLRVFNAEGEMVPHSFQIKTSEAFTATSTQELSFFPIEGTTATASGDSEITLSENAQGKVLNVRLKGAAAKAKSAMTGYLVDLRKQKLPVNQLKIDWQSKQKNGIVELDVWASDDLRTWRTVESGVTLAKFAYQGQDLEKNSIELPTLKTNFLRISWRDNPGFEIKKIEGDFVSGGVLEQKTSQIEVAALSSENSQYFYEKPPMLADKLSVLLPETNTVIRVNLSSRNSPNGSWVNRFSGPVYRIQQEGGEVSSDAQTMGLTADRYWRLQVEGKEAQLGKKSPTLRFSWISHQVYFLGRGKGPFKIAYGNVKAVPPDFGFDSLLDSLPKKDGEVQFSFAKLAGPETVVPQKPVVVPPPEIPWKKYALWACLLGALLVSGLMAWKLYSELNKK